MSKRNELELTGNEIAIINKLFAFIKNTDTIDSNCLPITLKVAYDEYLIDRKEFCRPRTITTIEGSFKPLFNEFGGACLLNSIDQRKSELLFKKIVKKAPKGAFVYLRHLKAGFNKFVKYGYIKKNPFDDIKLPKLQKEVLTYPTAEEFELILLAIEIGVVREIAIISFDSGMRISEIINLKYREIDFDRKLITIGSSEFITKSKKVRQVPMTERVNKLLLEKKVKEKRFSEENYIFTKISGCTFTTDYISKKFKAAVRQVKVNQNYHFHSLRHGFASRLVQNGVPLVTVSKLLGHANISTTMIYQGTNLDDLRSAIEKL